MQGSTASFVIGLVVGGVFGLILAGLLGSAHRGDYLADMAEAYNDGVENGKAHFLRSFIRVTESPAGDATLRAAVNKHDREVED